MSVKLMPLGFAIVYRACQLHALIPNPMTTVSAMVFALIEKSASAMLILNANANRKDSLAASRPTVFAAAIAHRKKNAASFPAQNSALACSDKPVVEVKKAPFVWGFFNCAHASA